MKEKHNPNTQRFITSKEDMKEVLERAQKKAFNKPTHTKAQNYMMRDGIPHKLKEGRWVPLTKIN
jgi:hypothetical protein